MQRIKLITTCLFIYLFRPSLYTQTSFPLAGDHQVWEYVTWNFWGGNCSRSFVKTGEEVDICGLLFTEVYDCYLTQNDCQLIGYYRVEGDSVMVLDLKYSWNGAEWEILPDCDEGERLMYDFNADVGDTLICGINPTETTYFWKVGEDVISYEGIPRRVSQMNFHPYPNIPEAVYNMKWIRNIGSNIHPFYPLSCIGDHCEQEQQLVRVIRDDEVIYLDTVLMFSFPCNNWETSIDEPKDLRKQIEVFPNPTAEVISLHWPNETIIDIKNIKIYDTLGREVSFDYFDKQKSEISLKGLTAGIYYVLISLNEQSFFKKIIKSE